MRTTLEICCGNWESVCAAVQGGADRIELCSALPLGGITPTIGLLKQVKETFPTLPTHVLIRPREGDFVYTPEEIRAMLTDIHLCRQAGAQGIVSGALLPSGEIDVPATRLLIEAAQACSFTFHRAFDHTNDLPVALETLINLGCTRLLTSGGASTAWQGMEKLSQLVKQAAGRLIVMAGAGISPTNARTIVKETGVTEIHASCTVKQRSSNDQAPSLGKADEGTIWVTQAQRVKELKNAIIDI